MIRRNDVQSVVHWRTLIYMEALLNLCHDSDLEESRQWEGGNLTWEWDTTDFHKPKLIIESDSKKTLWRYVNDYLSEEVNESLTDEEIEDLDFNSYKKFDDHVFNEAFSLLKDLLRDDCPVYTDLRKRKDQRKKPRIDKFELWAIADWVKNIDEIKKLLLDTKTVKHLQRKNQTDVSDEDKKAKPENAKSAPKPVPSFPKKQRQRVTSKLFGRENDLNAVHKFLQEHGTLAIRGMPGVGKTALARAYTSEHQHDYANDVCWLEARNSSNIGSKIIAAWLTHPARNPYKNIPDYLKEEYDQTIFCWNHWPTDHALIVFDDVIHYGKVSPYIPQDISRFKVLITTRLKLDNPLESLMLAPLDEESALDLLKNWITKKRVESELKTATKLCQRLGYLPLALQLIGNYLRKHRTISLQEIFQRLKNNGMEDHSLQAYPNADYWTLNDIEQGVHAAILLSWNDLSESAQQLGCLLSLFALAPIPWSLTESAYTEMQSNEDDSEAWEEASSSLEHLHLLEWFDETDCYQVHQLIYEFLQTQLEESNDNSWCEHIKQSLARTIAKRAKEFPQAPVNEDIDIFTSTMPHIAEVAINLQTWLSYDDVVSVFKALKNFYAGQGVYIQAIPWAEKYLTVTKSQFGDEHPEVAISLHELAGLYYQQGRYREAEVLCRKAVEMHRQTSGDENTLLANSLDTLALIYYSQGYYDKAEPLYQEALVINNRWLGEQNPELLREINPQLFLTLNNLALLYSTQGFYDKAEPLYQDTLKLQKMLFGEQHPDVAICLYNLGLLYQNQQRYSEAEPLYQEAIAIYKRLLGEQHPKLATCLNVLGLLYHQQQRYSEAEPLYQEALSIRKKLLGEEHPDVAESLNNLGGIYACRGFYSEAEPLYQEALATRKRYLGDGHPIVAESFINLAVLYQDQERFSEAKSLYEKALVIREGAFGKEHPKVAEILTCLALLFCMQECFHEAYARFRESLLICENTLGYEHHLTITNRQYFDILDNKIQHT